MKLYREFTTQEELDEEYDCERTVTTPEGLDALRAGRAEVNRPLLSAPWRTADVHYGPTLAERLDVYRADAVDAPIVLYIHGGYWSAPVPKESLGWVSTALREHGVTTVVMDYALCPAVTIGEIVRQARAALAWVHRNAASFGGDPDRIYVTGNSAGGHLTAMLAATDWAGEYGLPADVVKGACPFSGLYDLSPLRYAWVQAKLQLTQEEIGRNSPLFHVAPGSPPLMVVWGADETAEFWRQSESFGERHRAAGNDVSLHPVEGRDHYSLLSIWREPDGAKLREILAHMHACW
jgi:arylformamidase